MVKPLHHVSILPSPMLGTEAMSLQSSRAFPRHSHDQLGIGVISRGAQRSWSVLGQLDAGPGDVIIVNPGEIHDGVPLDGTRHWQMVYLDPELLWTELQTDGYRADSVLRPQIQDKPLSRQLLRMFWAMHQADSDSSALEEALLLSMMHISHHHLLTERYQPRMTPSIKLAKQYMDETPTQPISLSELADLSQLSRFQLLRGFARELGITPHAYLLQLRVRQARRYLAKKHTIVDAAMLSGFADQSHLTRAFVRQLGVTPARYQKAIFG